MALTGKPTVYVETSVLSYYVGKRSRDPIVLGHQLTTHQWWEDAAERFRIFVSQMVVDEAKRGDSKAAALRLKAIVKFPKLAIKKEARELAKVYLMELPLPPTARADALHLAVASVNQLDFLVTWNCHHIANGAIMKALPEVTAAHGYASPTICTPEELLNEKMV